MDHHLRQMLREYAASGDPEIAIAFANASLRIGHKFPSYLAIGFHYENAHTFSRCVENIDSPQNVYNFLADENGGGSNGVFDEILIVKNDEDCPGVVHHWLADKDYTDYPLPLLQETSDDNPHWDAHGQQWYATFETNDLDRIGNTPWAWNINEEDNVAHVNLGLDLEHPDATEEQLDAALDQLIQTLQEEGYSIEGW